MESEFSKKVDQYLEYSGWIDRGTALWSHAENTESPYAFMSRSSALYMQLKKDFENEGDIERAAEILS